MTNMAKLEIALIRIGMSKREFAQLLGISIQALYNKLNNIVEFKASEIMRATKLLNLTSEERDEIFFANFVDKKSTSKSA